MEQCTALRGRPDLIGIADWTNTQCLSIVEFFTDKCRGSLLVGITGDDLSEAEVELL